MAVKVSFLKAAKQDIKEAFQWYEHHQIGLGGSFLSEIEKALTSIELSPKGYPVKYKTLRVKLIHKFPYALFYQTVEEKNVRIYACLYLKRNLKQILKNR